jgi:hypothetical protein
MAMSRTADTTFMLVAREEMTWAPSPTFLKELS